MTTSIFRTSPQGSASISETRIVDATDGNQTETVPLATDAQSNGWPLYEQVTVTKKDASANTVTVQDATPTSIGVLETEGDSMTIFCDGAAWRIISNTSSTDVSTHAALTTAHGSTGAVAGDTDVSGALVAPRITEIHTTGVQDVKVITFSPGAATAVNFWNLAGSGASDPITLSADGTGANLDIELTPKGTGRITENATPVAIQAAAQADSTAAVLADLKTDFNSLLAKLRTGRMLAP